jgi:hypothetical protein
MLAFWAYYADPSFGKAFSWITLIGLTAFALAAVRAGVDWRVGRQILMPVGLWALASGFVLFLGFAHGGFDNSVAMAATRFSHQLPSDNDMPRYFAEWIYVHGHRSTAPPLSSWLSSDRPPLQMGVTLFQRPFAFGKSPALHYQVLAVLIQQLWIVAAWALLSAANLPARMRGLAILAAIVSDVAIVHSFFVWPKLLAAAFLLGALALVLSESWETTRRDAKVGALFAVLCALSMLAHGGSAFALMPLLVFAAIRGLPSWKWLAVALACALVLLLPWSAYQRYGDPPGNRLLKYQLAGVAKIDGRSVIDTIGGSYSEAGFSGVVDNKVGNAEAVADVDGTADVLANAGDRVTGGELSEFVGEVRALRFFGLLPTLGVLLIAIPAMLFARVRGPRDGPEWRFAVTALLLCVAIAFTWMLIMFGGPNATTVIHSGTLVLPLLAIMGCVAGLGATHLRLAYAAVGVSVVTALALYTPSLAPPPGSAYSAAAGFIAAIFLSGLLLLSLRNT